MPMIDQSSRSIFARPEVAEAMADLPPGKRGAIETIVIAAARAQWGDDVWRLFRELEAKGFFRVRIMGIVVRDFTRLAFRLCEEIAGPEPADATFARLSTF